MSESVYRLPVKKEELSTLHDALMLDEIGIDTPVLKKVESLLSIIECEEKLNSLTEEFRMLTGFDPDEISDK